MRPGLPEGQVAAKNGEPRGAERIRQRREKRGAAVGTGAMRQDQAVCARKSRPVQESSNRCVLIGVISEFVKVVHIVRRMNRVKAPAAIVKQFPSWREVAFLRGRHSWGRVESRPGGDSRTLH